MLLSNYDMEFRNICYQLGKIEEIEAEERKIEEYFPGLTKLSEEMGYNLEVCYILSMAAGDDAIRIIKEAKEKGYSDGDLYFMSNLYFQVDEYEGIKMHGPIDFKKLSEELYKVGKGDKESKLPRKLRKGW
jgi:hypothetical protein